MKAIQEPRPGMDRRTALKAGSSMTVLGLAIAAGLIPAREALVHLHAGRRAEVHGYGERQALLRRRVEDPVTQLAGEAGVAAECRRRPGEDADEVRELTGGGEGPLDHRERSLGRGEVVVDGEAAHGSGHDGPSGAFTGASQDEATNKM